MDSSLLGVPLPDVPHANALSLRPDKGARGDISDLPTLGVMDGHAVSGNSLALELESDPPPDR